MRVFCVTGMHRSGTSLVARLAALGGMHLGDEDALLPAAPDNPKGFWESSPIKTINDQVLARLGGTWIDPPPALIDGWEMRPALDDLRLRAADVVAEVGRDHAIAGWKDPRTSLTLPFWRTVCPIEGTLLVVRHPSAVAASLAKRNGITAHKAAELWLRYTLAAWTSDPDALVLTYSEVLQDPQATVEVIAAHMGAASPNDAVLRVAAEFTDPTLDHSATATPDDPELGLAVAVYDMITGDGPTSTLHIAEALTERWRVDPGLRLLEASIRAADTETSGLDIGVAPFIEAAKDRLQHLADQVQSLETSLRKETAANQELKREKVRFENEAHNLRQAVDRRSESIKNKDEMLVRLRSDQAAATHNARTEQDRLRAVAEQLRQDMADERSAAQKREEHLAAELRKANSNADQARAAAKKTRQDLKRLKNRRLVRWSLALGKPARPAFRAVRRLRGGRPANRSSVGSTSKEDGRGGSPGPKTDVLAAVPPETAPPFSPQPIGPGAAALRLDSRRPPTVLIPVYNALDEVRACVESIFRNTSSDVELLIIDDASPDPLIAPFLSELAAHQNVRVLTNAQNLGFVGTVNRGLASTDTDVVILNSDTEVTPGWIRNLRTAAYRSEDIGTATPLSDNAGAFAVPVPGQLNPIPGHLTRDQVGRAFTQTSERRYPDTPTGHGFCMYVKRDMLNEVGVLDIEAFPRGYGEENDLCMRAVRAGWRHVVDDATLIYHAQGASFGGERQELMNNARKVIDERYPDYTQRVRAFMGGDDMKAIRGRAEALFSDTEQVAPRQRVLFAIHAGSGGTPATNLDLMTTLAEGSIEPWMLTSDGRFLNLYRFNDGSLETVETLDLGLHLASDDLTEGRYREFVAHVLTEYAFELLHIRHLFKHTLDLPVLARSFGIPVVLSFHDFYYVCPTVNLLDDAGNWCAGRCTAGDGVCPAPRLEASPTRHLKHNWVYDWRDHIRHVFDDIDVFVTTTEFMRSTYAATYPELLDRPFEIIEHGRDLEQVTGVNAVPVVGGPIRIAVPGNLALHKGSRLIRRLIELDEAGRIEFHFFGDVKPEDADLGVVHGRYERDQFAGLLKDLSPHFVGLFSTTGESYSHTLTEAWACGVPVVASQLGALGERVDRHGGGWVFDPYDPIAALSAIYGAADDTAEYERRASLARIGDLPDLMDMSDRYRSMYEGVWERVVSRHSGSAESTVPVLDVLLPGKRGQWNASSYVRILQRLRHPATSTRLASRIWGGGESGKLFLDGARRVVLVQRTAIPDVDIKRFIANVAATRSRLIVDLDDNLLDPAPPLDEKYHQYAPSLTRLVEAADVVTVSTPALVERVAPSARRVELLPNHLDERVWFDGNEPEWRRSGAGPLRLLYMGTMTHSNDLSLLRPVIERLRHRGVSCELTVIGGEEPGDGQDWYRRLKPPRGLSRYPRFVRWLRTMAVDFDLGLAPLVDDEFNRYKSDLKFLEYSALGLAGVYSDVESYRHTVTPEIGVLVQNDIETWTEAIAALARDPQRRTAIARSAYRHVQEQRTLASNASRLLSLAEGASD